jgi:hypothetical protein
MLHTPPIIVTGADRSGTTLLYAILASHPEVSMVRRTNMWRWFYGGYGDLDDPVNLDRCLDAMTRYARMSVLEPDVEAIISAFRVREPTYGQLFSVMHEQLAERRGRSRWGDKSLHTEHHAAEIFGELPQAKMIQLVRDPRDRHSSVARRHADSQIGVGATTGRWLASVRVGQANAERFGDDRYRIVRYETLANHPESTVRELCEFLQLRYDPEMLEMRGVTDRADYSGNSSFEQIAPGVISTRSIGRYNEVLEPSTTRVIETLGRRWMKLHGYSPADVELSPREAVRFWGLEVPSAAVRSLGWRAVRVMQARHRQPPSHRLDRTGSPS